MNLPGMSGERFAELLTLCLPSVRKLVFARLRGGDDAEDIVQQTLLQAFRHRDRLRAHSKFKSWLWSIALNEIRMLHRRDRLLVPLHESAAIDCRDRAPSPLARLEELERSNWLGSAMARLSERDRAAIRLRDLNGLTLRETAKALRSSEPATKSAHFRARRRLETALRRSPSANVRGRSALGAG